MASCRPLRQAVRRLEHQVAHASAQLSSSSTEEEVRSLADLHVVLALLKADAELAAERARRLSHTS